MLVSVIIPTLNEEAYILDAIRAAQREYGVDEVEIIVVDGGSQDPHRPYEPGLGAGRGMRLDQIELPSAFPDSPTRSTCPWKGIASYYNVEVDGAVNADAAWFYPEPKEAAAAIKGRVAFWKGVEIIP